MGEEDAPEKKAAQEPAPRPGAQGRPTADQEVEDVAMAVLVLAPGFKESKQGRKAMARVGFPSKLSRWRSRSVRAALATSVVERLGARRSSRGWGRWQTWRGVKGEGPPSPGDGRDGEPRGDSCQRNDTIVLARANRRPPSCLDRRVILCPCGNACSWRFHGCRPDGRLGGLLQGLL